MSRRQLIEENLGLVHACANRFKNRGIEYDELYCAGCLGLVKAADGFKSELGFRFSTYAVPVILGEMKKLFRESGTVKVSRSVREKARFALREAEKFENSFDRPPTVNELAKLIDCDVYETSLMLNAVQAPVSLTSYGDGGDRQLDIPVESGQDEINDAIAVRQLISTMSDSDKKLITLRYYKGFTQVQTARILGMTQVQVSRRERALLSDMRQKMTG